MALDAQHSRKLLEDSEQGESTLTFVFLKMCSLPSRPVFSLFLRPLLLVSSSLPSPPFRKNKCPSGVMDPKVPATDERRPCPELGWNQGDHADGHMGMERAGRARKMGCWVGMSRMSQ